MNRRIILGVRRHRLARIVGGKSSAVISVCVLYIEVASVLNKIFEQVVVCNFLITCRRLILRLTCLVKVVVEDVSSECAVFCLFRFAETVIGIFINRGRSVRQENIPFSVICDKDVVAVGVLTEGVDLGVSFLVRKYERIFRLNPLVVAVARICTQSGLEVTFIEEVCIISRSFLSVNSVCVFDLRVIVRLYVDNSGKRGYGDSESEVADVDGGNSAYVSFRNGKLFVVGVKPDIVVEPVNDAVVEEVPFRNGSIVFGSEVGVGKISVAVSRVAFVTFFKRVVPSGFRSVLADINLNKAASVDNFKRGLLSVNARRVLVPAVIIRIDNRQGCSRV